MLPYSFVDYLSLFRRSGVFFDSTASQEEREMEKEGEKKKRERRERGRGIWAGGRGGWDRKGEGAGRRLVILLVVNLSGHRPPFEKLMSCSCRRRNESESLSMSSDLKSNSTNELVEVGRENVVKTHMMSRTINNPRMSGRD